MYSPINDNVGDPSNQDEGDTIIQGVGHSGGFREKLEDSGDSEDVSGGRCSGGKEDDRSRGDSRLRHEGSPCVLGPDEELGSNSPDFSCRNSFRLLL